MTRNWEEMIESREPDITVTNEKGKTITKKGQSKWKEELSKVTNHDELLDLFSYLTNELRKNLDKYYVKSNKTAGRRSRNYAQKIKDTMGQIRVVIQTNKTN